MGLVWGSFGVLLIMLRFGTLGFRTVVFERLGFIMLGLRTLVFERLGLIMLGLRMLCVVSVWTVRSGSLQIK